MAAKFEISSAKAGQFNWVLKSQGRTLATGESYGRKASAEKAIGSLRAAVAGATVSDLTVKPAKPAPARATAKRTAKPAKPVAKPAKTTRKAAGTAKKTKARGKRTAKRR